MFDADNTCNRIVVTKYKNYACYTYNIYDLLIDEVNCIIEINTLLII